MDKINSTISEQTTDTQVLVPDKGKSKKVKEKTSSGQEILQVSIQSKACQSKTHCNKSKAHNPDEILSDSDFVQDQSEDEDTQSEEEEASEESQLISQLLQTSPQTQTQKIQKLSSSSNKKVSNVRLKQTVLPKKQKPKIKKHPDKFDHMMQMLCKVTDRMEEYDKRLEACEKSRVSSCHDASSLYHKADVVPTIDTLKQLPDVDKAVDRRLEELKLLADKGNCHDSCHKSNCRLKPGCERTSEAKQRQHVVWPQELVYQVGSCKRQKFADLTIESFMEGALKTIEQEKDAKISTVMLRLLVLTMHTTTLTNWYTTRYAYSVILTEIEEGRLSWSDQDSITDLFHRYTQKTISMPATISESSIPNSTSPVPCYSYNKNKCSSLTDHSKNGRVYKHMCTYCWQSVKRAYQHPETECNRKKKADGTSKPPSD